MKSFETSSYLSKLRKLRKLAETALKQYPIKVKQLQFINHGENTTYKVIAAEGIFLLRIHRTNYHSKAAILEELKWLECLSKKMKNIQKPLLSKNGLLVETVTNEEVAVTRFCSLLSWKHGIMKTKSLTVKNMYATGLLTAELHKNSAKIKVKHRNYWTVEDMLNEDTRFDSFKNLQSELTKNQYDILDKCRKMTFKKIKQYQDKYPEKLSLIHADLHFGNIIWRKNEPIPIDFDDCGIGFHMYDISVSLTGADNLFRGPKKSERQAYVESLLEGYASTQNLTKADIDILPYFKLTRNLSILLWMNERKDNPFIYEHLKKTKQKRINYYKKVLKDGPNGIY